jgi:hypothetical protein
MFQFNRFVAITAITCTSVNTLYANNSANVFAWGANGNGQCNVPSELGASSAVAAGSYHSLAIQARTGTVWAWGDNTWGQSNVPADLGPCIAVSGGGGHSLALRADGTIRAWGRGNYGQNASPDASYKATAISAGGDHNAALLIDGTVIAWGANVWGERNVPATAQPSNAVIAGIWHKMAIRPDQTVVCWGRNNYGQCNVPSGLSGVIDIAAGQDSAGGHSMALRNNGSIVCWGNNGAGQCNTPSDLTDVVNIMAGGAYSMALKRDGSLACWGNNGSGQCNVPSGLPPVVAMAASDSHTIVLTKLIGPTEWPVSQGGNGHWYSLSTDASIHSFVQRQQDAESKGAHLCTLSSIAEHQFVFDLTWAQGGFTNGDALGWPALGGYRLPGTDQWKWITNEPFTYAPWGPTEPNGNLASGAYLQMWGANNQPNMTLDDNTSSTSDGGIGINPRVILEWSADCNGDGSVDYGQIFRGELADTNFNGIPDACELVINVPSQFATIQAAIDSATTGKTIEVAPGTYNEAIDFKGKAITVKATGARASTIIDGTGLTTSVVRAVTGETSATVLQGFTIRNGPIGSANNTYRLGGGIFISSASPTIRDCAFTANQSAYGGGMYALYSNSLIENCTFSQNSGSADGGGIQLFGGSPIVRNCVVSDNTAGNRGGGFHVVQHNTGAATLDGCTISGNRSNVSDGGGISMAPLAGAVQKFLVSNCTITNNSAQTRGGGLWAVVDPVNPLQNITLSDNTICNNTSAISKRENVWALFEDGGNTICDCISDISGDGDIDTGDLSYVLLFVGEPTDADFIQPDQDMNGFIDTADVSLVLLNMGACP